MISRKTTVIQTKLYRPPLPADFVPREKLQAMLEESARLPLILVSAPAGYGKTTVISNWLQQRATLSAWLSLDTNDSDLRTFLDGLLEAIRTVLPNACLHTRKLAEKTVLPSLADLECSLLNDLLKIEKPFSVVLDDYGFIHQQQIHDLLSALLEKPPQNFQLIITTRRDPPLPLVSLRAGSKVLEIRQNELHFSVAETAALLEKNVDISLDADTLAMIQQKIEGWAVGLRLVALSLNQRTDKEYFLRELKADTRHVQDYLISEILSRQLPEVRSMLLRTAIPNLFCASLCNELGAGEIDGDLFYLKLQESNLFCTFLDERSEWARYHHLFRDILLQSLQQLYSREEIAAIHRQSASWFVAHGYYEEGLEHYLEAGEPGSALSLVVDCRHELMNREEWPRLVQLLNKLPRTTIESNPVLSIQDAWQLWHQMRITDMGKALDRVEALLEAGQSVSGYGSVQAEIATLRSVQYYLGASCDGKRVHVYALKADQTIPAEHLSTRGLAKIMLTLSYQMVGDLRGAVHVVNEAMSFVSGKVNTLETRLLVALVLVYWLEGDLKSMSQIAGQLERISKDSSLPESNGIGYFFSGVYYYSRGELAAAEEYLQRALSESAIFSTFNYAHSSFVLALSYLAQGHPEKAEETANAVYQIGLETGNDTLLDLAQAFLAELAVRQGHLAATNHWVKQYDPEPLLAVHRFYVPQITLVKILLGHKTSESYGKAAELLCKLEEFFTANNNLRVLIEVYALHALLHYSLDEETIALEKLQQSLNLAEPGGFRQVYIDLGPEMAALLRCLIKVQNNNFALNLLADIDGQRTTPIMTVVAGRSAELLSGREFDILTQLSLRLTNKEIADRFNISPETVKRHTANIYKKLHAGDRRQAVEQAISLGVLSRV